MDSFLLTMPNKHSPASHFIQWMEPLYSIPFGEICNLWYRGRTFYCFVGLGRERERERAANSICYSHTHAHYTLTCSKSLTKHFNNSAISNSQRIDFRTTLMNVCYTMGMCRKFMLFANTYSHAHYICSSECNHNHSDCVFKLAAWLNGCDDIAIKGFCLDRHRSHSKTMMDEPFMVALDWPDRLCSLVCAYSVTRVKVLR